MSSNKPKFLKFCSEHPEEPILRVSLDPKAQKIFYCYDCLATLDKDAKSQLVKFSEFIDKLHEKIAEADAIPSENQENNDIVVFAAEKDQLLVKLDGFISQEKQRVDEELNQLEREIYELIKASKTHVHSNFDDLKTRFENELAEYLEKVEYILNLKTLNENPITKEELVAQFSSNQSPEQVEKNLRKIMEKIEIISELKSGKIGHILFEKKKGLEGVLGTSDLVVKKEENFYKQKLQALSEYFGALVLLSEGREEEYSGPKLNNRHRLERIRLSLNEFQGAFSQRGTTFSETMKRLFSLPEAQECSILANKLNKVEGEAFVCQTCFKDISSEEEEIFTVCGSCKDTCHKGHTLKSLGTRQFVCCCQFATPVCRFATTCTLKYTGNTKVYMLSFKCKSEDAMPLCHFCATVCHKDHEIKEKDIQNETACVCSSKFPHCKLNQ